VRRTLRTLGMRVAWLAAAILISFGGAGLAAALNRPPTIVARPELTWTDDRVAQPALAAAADSLLALEREVAELGSLGRLAITELAANDDAGIDDAIAQGTAQLGRVQDAVDAYRARLEAVPGIGEPDEALRLSQDLRNRYDVLVATVRETDDLAASWRALTAGTLGAHRLTSLLLEHDRVAGEALQAGSRAAYDEALDALDVADARLAAAREARDELAGRVDVATLDRWLERSAAYDRALRELYDALRESQGVVTARVREAAAAELAARERLPQDTRALVIIMADVARGGLNQAVIAIEETRASLDEARAALEGMASPSRAPGAG